MPLPDGHQAPQSAGKAGKNPQAPARHCKESLSITLPRNHSFIYKEQRISRLFPLGVSVCHTPLFRQQVSQQYFPFFLFPRIQMCFSFFFQIAAELSRRPSLKFFFVHKGLLSFSLFGDFTCLTEFRRISFCKTK